MTTGTVSRVRKRGWFGIVELSWFITLLATALAMAAAVAHALELPNKLAMGQQNYFAAQQSYRGWNQLAFLLSIEATGILALAISYRRVKPIWWRMLVALAMLVLAQLAFWFFTFPANQATENWTVIPTGWEQLRSRWEFSHLAGAVFQLLAFCFVVLAVLRWADLKSRKPDC